MRCSWGFPTCTKRPSEQRQLLAYCKLHARIVDANREALIGGRRLPEVWLEPGQFAVVRDLAVENIETSLL